MTCMLQILFAEETKVPPSTSSTRLDCRLASFLGILDLPLLVDVITLYFVDYSSNEFKTAGAKVVKTDKGATIV